MAESMTSKGLADEFKTRTIQRPDAPFCFILGAGASFTSGIPMAGKLAERWLEEHKKRHCPSPNKTDIEVWGKTLLGDEFAMSNVARYYPEIYSHRFEKRPEDGFADLEMVMDGKKPSYGYSVLAHIISEKPYKVVITTNFDNLIAEALSVHSLTFPRVVGHDELVRYVRVELRRPLIAKIHGDIGFATRNTPMETAQLSRGWRKALENILRRFTPIVVGYGGNDGSLMDFLEKLPSGVPECMYWCHLENQELDQRVKKLLAKRGGFLVSIAGFDDLMMEIQSLDIPGIENSIELIESVERLFQIRLEEYKKQRDDIGKREVERTQSEPIGLGGKERIADSATSPETGQFAQIVARALGSGDVRDWWEWELESRTKLTADEREEVYKRGLTALPGNARLLGNYAVFLQRIRRDYDKAEEYFQSATKADPKYARAFVDYAIFLQDIREEFNKAEDYYRLSIAANNNSPYALGVYALFLDNVRKEYEKAEKYYLAAIKANSKFAWALAIYAEFLRNVKRDFDKAEDYYKQATDADPKFAPALEAYAWFLVTIRRNDDLAEAYYKKAIVADARDANAYAVYAAFMFHARANRTGTAELFDRALKLDARHPNVLANYAQFCFLTGKTEEAQKALSEALMNVNETKHSLRAELLFYRLAHLPETWSADMSNMRDMIEKGARSLGWYLDADVKQAESENHPNTSLLRALAKVITEDASLTTLDEFPEWRNAKAPVITATKDRERPKRK